MQVLGLVCDSNPKKGVGYAMPLANYTLPDFLARCALSLLNSQTSPHDASDPARLTLSRAQCKNGVHSHADSRAFRMDTSLFVSAAVYFAVHLCTNCMHRSPLHTESSA